MSGLVIAKFRSLETLTRAVSKERSGKKQTETPYKQPFAAEESREMRREEGLLAPGLHRGLPVRASQKAGGG